MAGFRMSINSSNNNSNKKEVKKKEEPIKKREDLTESIIENVNFFKEDLESLDNEVAEAGKIYDEIHDLWHNLTDTEYLPRNIRDVAEVAKSMISARTYKAQAINNRIALKKTIADLNYRNKGGTDLEGAEQANLIARQIISTVRKESGSVINTQKHLEIDKRTVEGKKRAEEEKMLDKTIEDKLKSGDIKMGKNDNLIDVNKYVVIRYDAKNDEFIGVDSRTGKKIPDFPKDRLPNEKDISKINKKSAIMQDGGEVKVFDSLEFDDDYIDDAP